MPKQRKPPPQQRKPQPLTTARHTGSPEQPAQVIEGGIRPLPVQVEDGVQPLAALWVDGQTGMVLNYALVDPRQSPDNGTTEALAALEQALESPLLGQSAPSLYVPGAPAPAQGSRRSRRSIVVRTDSRLAAVAQLRLARFNASVEAHSDLPLFSLAFEELAQSLADAEPSEPFSWEIDEALLPPLFQAAADYARRTPWDFMLDHPPFAVALGPQSPLPGVETLYGSVLGAGGEVFGVAYYLSLDEYREALQTGVAMEDDAPEHELDDQELATMVDQLRRLGAPVDNVPPELLRGMLQEFTGGDVPDEPPRQESLVCFFDSEDETDPSYIEWLEEHGMTFDDEEEIPMFLRAGHQFDPRPPTAQEVQALTLALDATNQFLAAHQRTLRRHPYSLPTSGLHHTAQVGAGQHDQPIEVDWPAPGFDVRAELPLQ
jgi:hypothetical protein